MLLLLLLCGLLGIGYAWATPVGGAPDEGAHLRYVEVLATTRRLPVMNLEQRLRDPANDRDFEAHQPPLYYALAVAPYYLGRAVGGDVGIGWAVRLLSITLGMLGVVLVWRLVAEAVPQRPAIQLAATAFVALLPMRLAVMGSITNDGLLEVLSTLALLLMAKLIRGTAGPDLRRRSLELGLVIGLALLTKATALLLLPPALLALYLASGARDPEQRESGEWTGRFVSAGAVLGGVVLLLTGWWFARNHVLYGDALGKRMFDEYFANTFTFKRFRDELGLSFGDYMFRVVLPTSFASFWGAFGHLTNPRLFMGGYNPARLEEPWASGARALDPLWPIMEVAGKPFIPYRSWVYPLLVVAVLASLAGWAVTLFRRRMAPAAAPPPSKSRIKGAKRGTAAPEPTTEMDPGPERVRLTLAVHAVFNIAALMSFNATYFQGQGRYLLPAIAALALAIAGGWLAWSRRQERWVAWGIAGGMAVLALYALFGVLLPGFQST